MKRNYFTFTMYKYLLLPLLLIISPVSYAALPKIDLRSPYHTIRTHFRLANPGKTSVEQINKLFTDKTLTPHESHAIALTLQQLLTIQNVNVETIPHHPNYIDPITHEHRCIITDALPQIYLIKEEEEWCYSKETVLFIKQYGHSFKLRLLLYSFLAQELLEKKIFSIAVWQYIILIGLAIINWIVYKIFKRILRKLIGGTTPSKKHFFIERLLLLFIIISFIKMVLPMFPLYPSRHINQNIINIQHRLINAALSFVLMCLAYSYVNIVQERIKKAKRNDVFIIHTLPLCGMAARIIVMLVGLVKTIENLGFSTGALVTSAGWSAVGLGFASRDILSSLFTSLMFVIDRPYNEGDDITTNMARGKVEQIGLRATILRTEEETLLYIPHTKLADTQIDNTSRKKLRIVSLEIPLSYDSSTTALPQFLKKLLEIIQQQPFVQQEKSKVYLNEMKKSFFTIVFKVYLTHPESQYEEEYKNRVIPLILQLATQLNLRLGVIDFIKKEH